jgi:hypothetical protein
VVTKGVIIKGVYCIKIGQIKIMVPWKSGKYVRLKAINCPKGGNMYTRLVKKHN